MYWPSTTTIERQQKKSPHSWPMRTSMVFVEFVCQDYHEKNIAYLTK